MLWKTPTFVWLHWKKAAPPRPSISESVAANSLASLPSISLRWSWGNRSLKNPHINAIWQPLEVVGSCSQYHTISTYTCCFVWIAMIAQHSPTAPNPRAFDTQMGRSKKKLDTFSVRYKKSDLQQLLRQKCHVDHVGQEIDHCQRPNNNVFFWHVFHALLRFMLNAWISIGCTAVR